MSFSMIGLNAGFLLVFSIRLLLASACSSATRTRSLSRSTRVAMVAAPYKRG